MRNGRCHNLGIGWRLLLAVGLLPVWLLSNVAVVLAVPPSPPSITEPATDGQVINAQDVHMEAGGFVGSSRVDLQACKLEYSIVSPK